MLGVASALIPPRASAGPAPPVGMRMLTRGGKGLVVGPVLTLAALVGKASTVDQAGITDRGYRLTHNLAQVRFAFTTITVAHIK